ncbi:MAG: response regulator [Aphanothece sp. CMT-3BRIN-NPC111]|jgi:CheY-like chemotaxis protein|nr:response regulator [Aphanothece sp. CMT-3BRIN-NPC111]
MNNSPPTVLIIQSSQVQRAIWQQTLQSQEISAIAQSPEADPRQTLIKIQQAGSLFPDLLLIDTQLPNLNPETFCQWCVQNFPTLKIILINGDKKEVSPSERQTAINYGAFDLLPAFQLETLSMRVIAGVKRVLAGLNGKLLQNDPLVSCLIALKREIDSHKLKNSSLTESQDIPNLELPHAQSNSKSLNLKDSSSSEPPQPSPPVNESPPKKAPKRNYRGAAY